MRPTVTDPARMMTDTSEDQPRHGDGRYDEWPTTVKGNMMQSARTPDGQVVVSRRKQVSLVLFSGGIDSTYTLMSLLADSEDEIVAHHIHLKNREGRHNAEAAACDAIIRYLKDRHRPFHYVQSGLDRRRFDSFGLDVFSVAFEAGFLNRSFSTTRGFPIDRWTMGFCLEEREERQDDPFRAERFGHILSLIEASSFPLDPPRFFQLPLLRKKTQIERMGRDLTDLCWTCRTPIAQPDGRFTECGECKTCVLMEEIRHDR